MVALYGSWQETVVIVGTEFRADIVDDRYAAQTEFKAIYAIDGLPLPFERDLVRSSQVCDGPHTWRVQECASLEAVTDEIVERGLAALSRDRNELNAHIFTYVGDRTGDRIAFEFLAAGAVRNKLTRQYENNEFPVVSRAIVAPQFRGLGLGALIVEHRMKAVRSYFGPGTKAIHFGTESKLILRSIAKFEREENLKFVHIGDEQYTTIDGTHSICDYLCFLPTYRIALLAACDVLVTHPASAIAAREFTSKLALFMTEGIAGVSGTDLEKSFEAVRGTIELESRGDAKLSSSLDLIRELFLVKEKIGARDPE